MHEVTIDEVKAAFKRLGTNKAVGVDGLPAEFITKASCDGCPINIFHDVIARTCNIMLKCQLMPDNWKTKAITPVFKKGVRTDPNNYRPIAVSTTFYRIFTCIIGQRLTEYLHKVQPDTLLPSQFGFRRGLGVEHAHLILITCCEEAIARNKQLAIVKLDITKAYDTVVREQLWDSIRKLGLPEAFVQLIQELYRSSAYSIKVNGTLSEEFLSDMGLLQGCSLSPQCYNMYLRELLHEIEQRCQHMGIPFFGWRSVHVNYADDVT